MMKFREGPDLSWGGPLEIGGAEDFYSALEAALKSICEATSWAMGQVWVPTEDGSALEASPIWCTNDKRLNAFRESNAVLAFEPWHGLPGRAWAAGKPVWVRDISVEDEDAFPRAPLAAEHGLKAGVCIPVLAGAKVVAVLDFFMVEEREEDERLVGLVAGVAGHLGNVFRRKQAEDALRRSEAFGRAVLDTASDAIISITADGLVRSFNRAAERIFGYAALEVVGRPTSMLMPERYRDSHERGLRRYLETGEARVIGMAPVELAGLRKDGTEFPLELSLGETRQGETVLFTGIIRDVADRKQAERDLRRLGRQNELILEAAGEGIYGLDARGKTTFVNPAAARMLGWDPEDLIGRPQHETIHHSRPDGDRYPVGECPILATLTDGEVYTSSDEVFWRKDGTSFPVEYTSTPILEEGEVRGAVVTFDDITERKRAEASLRQSEAGLAEAQKIVHLGSWEAEPASPDKPRADHAMRWSDEMFRILGYAPQQFSPTFGSLMASTHPDDREHVPRVIGEAVARGETSVTVEHRVVRPGGEVRFVQAQIEMVMDQDRKLIRNFGTVLDITERKEAEEELRRSERRLLSAQRIAHVGDWGFDVADNRAHWSDEMYRIFGLTPQETITYRRFLGLVHPGDRGTVKEAARRALGGEPRSSLDYRVLRSDGEVRFVHSEYEVTRDASGRTTALGGTLQDVTGPRKAEARLREQAQILDLAPVLVRNLRDEILLWNTGAEMMYGWDAAEATGRVTHDLLRSEHPEAQEEIKRKILTEGRWEGEVSHVRKDGERVLVASLQVLHRDERGDPVAILEVNNDVTERRRAEEALRESEVKYRTLVNSISAITYIQSPDEMGDSLYVSPQVEEIVGYTPEECAREPDLWVKMLHPDDRERVLAEDARTNATGEPFRMEYRQIAKDGSVVWLRDEAGLTYHENGEPKYWVGIQVDITDRKRSEEALRTSEASLAEAQRIAHLGSWEYEPRSGRARWSDETYRLFGFPVRQFEPTVQHFLASVHPEDRDLVREDMAGVLREGGERGEGIEFRIVRSDGEVRFVQGQRSVEREGADGEVKVVGTILDITDRKLAEQQVRQSEERFRALVQNSLDVVTVVDARGTVLYYSPSVQAVMGYRPEDFIGKKALEVVPVHPDDRPRVREIIHHLAKNPGASRSMEMRMRHADGSWRTIEATANNLLSDPSVGGIVTNYRDVTLRKDFERRLEYQALHDDLTGLPSRALFMDRLGRALARGDGVVTAVMFMDFDNFKVVNDSLGHQAGDELLVAAAERLGECCGPTDTMARHGGDEFIVLMEDAGGGNDAAALAERFAGRLREPFELRGRKVHLTASLGIAFGRPDVDRPEELLRRADIAMYKAKHLGKDRYELFDPVMDAEARDRLELENDLRGAVRGEEFEVYYQPTVSLREGEITGYEALLRWEHPERGPVPPSRFIPIAEETGLIVPLGRQVLREACRQARSWQEQHRGGAHLTVSVNLSAKQFQNAHLTRDVATILRETGLSEHLLCLEVTETVAMQDHESAAATLHELKGLGVKVALDDFGTGYSSLSYLKDFPLDYLKIDRSIVTGMEKDGRHRAIVLATITLAHALGLGVVAEGVETAEELEALRSLQCDFGQGHYFSAALPAVAVERLPPSPPPNG